MTRPRSTGSARLLWVAVLASPGRLLHRPADAAKAAYIDVMLFDAFARLKRIHIQAVTPRGQFKRTLVAPARRVELVR